METSTKYQPRIVRGRVEIWVPHKDREIAFASPSAGPNTYRNVGTQILQANQKVPTGDYTASLLYPAYCDNSVADEPEFSNVRDILKNKWLWVYNRNLWTDKGAYVIQDLDATGRSKPLEIKDLEKMLEDGRELSFGGIRFSKDEKVRFAPKGSYVLSDHTPESFAKDGFIIASCGQEGAEKLGQVSDKFKNKPYSYGVRVQEGQTPEQRVSAVGEGSVGLSFTGDYWTGSDYCAFGVL